MSIVQGVMLLEQAKKPISLFTVNTFPPIEGGVQQYLYDICSGMKNTGVYVLAPSVDEGKEREFDSRQSFEIVRLKPEGARFGIFSSVLKLQMALAPLYRSASKGSRFKLLQVILGSLRYRYIWGNVVSSVKVIMGKGSDSRIELTHAGYILPCGVLSYILKNLFGIPYILYTYGKELFLWEEEVVSRLLMREVLKEADRVVTISDFTRKKLLELGVPGDKTFMLYPVINRDRLESSADGDPDELRKRYNLKGKKVILTIAHLVERKGQDMVIRAMPEIIEKNPDAVYVIGGRGPMEPRLKELASNLGVSENVRFIGLVPDDEISLHYRMCDVFTMVSRRIGSDVEGFGIVYLEAGYWGKPVVAGRSGGVEDAVLDGETGILVGPESPQEISKAIIRLLDSGELREKLGVAGRDRVLKEFTFNPGEKVEELSRRILLR